MSAPGPILIATCGNGLAGDDAFGPLMARALCEHDLPGAEIVELGMNPTALLDRLAGGCGALILIDAAEARDLPPGRLIEFDWNAPGRPALRVERSVSTHGLSVAGQLDLALGLGLLPPVVRIIAVTAAAAETGETVSAACRRQIEPAVERVRRLVSKMGRAAVGRED